MTGYTTAWAPPSGPSTVLLPAGRWWDAVTSPADWGDHALGALGLDMGAVIRDPWGKSMYWLIEPGAGDAWQLERVGVLGVACWVAVPPVQRVAGPGPHWAVPPTAERWLTAAGPLHDALSAAIRREGAVR